MPRYAFLIEYDGTPFAGWQRQEAQPSVQAAVEAALARLDPMAPAVTGAGRTDTAVHAAGQVAHADLSRAWEPFRLAEALNAHLRPLPVAILDCVPVSDAFHARFSATERSYRYRILNRRAPPTLTAGRVWHVKGALDAGAMEEAAQALVGRHDFTTFRSSMCQAKSPLKTLDEASVRRDGDEIVLEFRARSFLHNQVRSMVGSLERVGAGGWSVERVAQALAARSRAACGPVAPPQGLCLMAVGYPGSPFRGA
jgi:tRNA pseudouridine38-40 synthase